MGEDSRASRDVSWGQQRVAANRECGMHRGAGRVYRIVVRSELSERYATAFEEMEMETKGGQTVLTGEVVDQVQLHGIIDRIGGLGLEIVSVQSLPEGIQSEA